MDMEKCGMLTDIYTYVKGERWHEILEGLPCAHIAVAAV